MLNSMWYFFIKWGGIFLFPIALELLKNICVIPVVLTKALKQRKSEKLETFPLVSILIPVYRSAKTLKDCLESIVHQTYPVCQMEVFLLNNGDDDGSYQIYQEFHHRYPDLKIWWLNTKQGKSKALNEGIYLSKGKYIINVDSDGWLDPNAIYNIVARFEKHPEIGCMTGVVLTDPRLIEEKNKKRFIKWIQKCEFYEYVDSFLIGRNFQSALNSLYTLAGAFSCFRKEEICKTPLYNFDTLGEDTHMTLQLRINGKKKIVLCEDAFIYVDPIESLDKLYMQRQRWQRSVIEMAQIFKDHHMGGITDLLKKPLMRFFIFDHTLMLLRVIWISTLIYFITIQYPLLYFLTGTATLYLVYVSSSFFYQRTALLFLPASSPVKAFIKKHQWTALSMISYRFMLFFIRLAGIINSLTTEASWYAKPLSEELREAKSMFRIKKNLLGKQ